MLVLKEIYLVAYMYQEKGEGLQKNGIYISQETGNTVIFQAILGITYIKHTC